MNEAVGVRRVFQYPAGSSGGYAPAEVETPVGSGQQKTKDGGLSIYIAVENAENWYGRGPSSPRLCKPPIADRSP